MPLGETTPLPDCSVAFRLDVLALPTFANASATVAVCPGTRLPFTPPEMSRALLAMMSGVGAENNVTTLALLFVRLGSLEAVVAVTVLLMVMDWVEVRYR